MAYNEKSLLNHKWHERAELPPTTRICTIPQKGETKQYSCSPTICLCVLLCFDFMLVYCFWYFIDLILFHKYAHGYKHLFTSNRASAFEARGREVTMKTLHKCSLVHPFARRYMSMSHFSGVDRVLAIHQLITRGWTLETTRGRCIAQLQHCGIEYGYI